MTSLSAQQTPARRYSGHLARAAISLGILVVELVAPTFQLETPDHVVWEARSARPRH